MAVPIAAPFLPPIRRAENRAAGRRKGDRGDVFPLRRRRLQTDACRDRVLLAAPRDRDRAEQERQLARPFTFPAGLDRRDLAPDDAACR